MATIKEIIDLARQNNPKTDTEIIELAFEFAKKAHKNQKRKTGEPYINHPLATAKTLAEMKTDTNVIVAGLLHDVPEDTDYTLEDVEKNFGKEVAELVKGITKLSIIKYRGVERYIESLRKLFLAMANDIRVILIKFADRLNNLQTLYALPDRKQKRIAQETMEIYVPIAGLLGIWHLKWQLEDLCFKYLQPKEFKKMKQKYLVEEKMERDQYIDKVKKILENKLNDDGLKNFQITGRFKHLYGIYQKMQTKYRNFDEIHDVFALRVVVETIPECYKVVGSIHSLWKPLTKRFKDYIAVPKVNGYRSIHTTVFALSGRITEFQIRTKKMDLESKYGIAAHWYYKQKDGENTVYHQPEWVKNILEIQKHADTSNEFINRVKVDVFQHRIFVFTPKGDVIDLPRKSTPIDFAYHIHTDIGNKATGALINEKIAPLNAILKSGDLVKIITEKNRKGPSRDWLKFVKTHTAKSKIKQNLPPSMIGKVLNKIRKK